MQLPTTSNGAVGLDISAAFDTIYHDVLFDRLWSQFGVNGAALSWLRSHLTNRVQFIKLGEQFSETTPIVSGVPHGSVPGSLLFTAYISPVGNLIEAHNVSYH